MPYVIPRIFLKKNVQHQQKQQQTNPFPNNLASITIIDPNAQSRQRTNSKKFSPKSGPFKRSHSESPQINPNFPIKHIKPPKNDHPLKILSK